MILTEQNFNQYYSRYSSTSSGSSKQSSKPTPKSTTSQRSRLVRQPQSADVASAVNNARTRSRFNPLTTRQRIRSQSNPRTQAAATTTTPKPNFSRFRPRTVANNNNNNRFTSSGRRPSSSIFDYDDEYDYDYDLELEGSLNKVPDAITVTHTVAIRTQIPVFENGRNNFRDILTTSPSLEVIAVTALKSTNIDGSPVIYANVKTDTPNIGTQVLTYEALRATETTAIEMTPTRIRGLRTSASHAIPSTIYNIRPVTTSIVQEVNSNDLLSSLLLQLLGQQGLQGLGQTNAQIKPTQQVQSAQAQRPDQQQAPRLAQPAQVQPSAPVPATQFITHTSTYTTTLTNTESKILPLTFRGREIKTTLIETNTEVVTATELSTETKIAPTLTLPAAGGLGGLILPTAQSNPLGNGGLSADLQQQLLLAQLQQQLLNQQLLSQVNLDQEGASLVEQTQIPDPVAAVAPSYSLETVFVSGSKPGEFSRIIKTVTLDGSSSEERYRYKREALVQPSPVLPITRTTAPALYPSSSPIQDSLY